MDITINNIEKFLPLIIKNIECAEIVGYDTEFTGLNKYGNNQTLFDDGENRYMKVKAACKVFAICQIGLSLYIKCESKEEYQVYTYNIYCKELDIGTFDPIVSFQSSSIKFLLSYNFDFEKCYSNGVPYANEVQLDGLKDLLNQMSMNQFVDEVLSPQFIKKANDNILKFIYDGGIDLKLNFPMNSRPLEKEIFINYVNVTYPKLNIRETEDGTGFFINQPSSQLIAPKNVDNGKALQSLKERYIIRANALSTIIHKIFFGPCEVEKSRFVVGHNCFVDLMLLYQKMINPLPPTLNEFKKVMFKAKHDKLHNHEKQTQTNEWDGDDIIPKPIFRSDSACNLPILYDTRHLMLTLKEWYNSYPKPYEIGTSLRGDKTPPTKRTIISYPKLKPRLFDYFDLSECYDKFCLDRSQIEHMLLTLKPHNVKHTPPRHVNHSPTTPKYSSSAAPDGEPSPCQSSSSHASTSAPHEAGYDAYMCAHLFYQLRRTYAHALDPSSHPLDPGSGYALFRSCAFVFNLILARVPHLNLKGERDPPTARPPLIALRPLGVSSSVGSNGVFLVEVDPRPGSRDYAALPGALKGAMAVSRRVSRFTALAVDESTRGDARPCFYLATAKPTFCDTLVEELKSELLTCSHYACTLMLTDFRYIISTRTRCPKDTSNLFQPVSNTRSPLITKVTSLKPLSIIVTSSLILSLGVTTFFMATYKGS